MLHMIEKKAPQVYFDASNNCFTKNCTLYYNSYFVSLSKAYINRCQEMGLPTEPYEWYIDLPHFGTIKHCGAYTKKDYKKSPNALENPLFPQSTVAMPLMDKAQRTQLLIASLAS
ncbi:hypothetical protein DVH24_027390 [Malus domestica]|uniref:Uncharacterized protein n=1 Tax=Malus domestica TaxID=3750 RepID=A0A498H8Y3_MALDO|nr:hypothetical protein DVH24_027390 [Malus domestica]